MKFEYTQAPRSLYGCVYRRCVWPFYEGIRGRQTPGLLRQAQSRQWSSSEEIERFSISELNKLLQHANLQTDWYRQRFAASRLNVDSLQSLKEMHALPTTTKADIRKYREQMVAAEYRSRCIFDKTGGSTGEPVQFYYDRRSYEWRNAMTARGYGWAGADEGEKAFYLWSIAVDNPSRWQRFKTSAHDWSLRRKFFNNFRLSQATLPECLESLNRFAPRVLVGYTSMLEYLARYIQKQGGLRIKLQSVITAAEGVNAAQRELLQAAFGAPVFASYGSREFKLIAMECEQGGLHVAADNLIVECLIKGRLAQPGELGAVVITDLHNYGMPFIRYEIGDVATPCDDRCACGRGLPLLGAVHGRVPDTVQTPDGRLISGIFFPHLLKEFAWIEQFQVVQKELDRVQVKLIVIDSSVADRELGNLKQRILEVLGSAMRLEFEFVAEIPRNATGKHRPVISEIPVII